MSLDPKLNRRALLALAGLLAAVLLVLGGLLYATGSWRLLVPADRASVAIGPALGGPFRLTDQTGAVFDSRRLAGRPHLVFFGFTNCPDVCPTTMFELSQTMRALAADPTLSARVSGLPILFVTVDPERDTPELLRQYLASFEAKIVGLSGTPDEIARTIAAYKVYARRVPLAGGGYTMDHTASVLLFDGNGQFTGTLSSQETEETRRRKIANLLRNG